MKAFRTILCYACMAVAPTMIRGEEPTEPAGAASTKAAPSPPVAPYHLEHVRSFDKGGTVYSLGFLPDGRRALIGGDMSNKGMKVWNAETGETEQSLKPPGINVACAPDGQHGAMAGIGSTVQLFTLVDGELVREYTHGSFLTAVSFSPDGSQLASAGVDKTACIWNVDKSDEPRMRLRDHEGAVTGVVFSADGQRIVTSCEDKSIRIWNARSGQLIRAIPQRGRIWSTAISPDGRRILSGTGGPQVGGLTQMDVLPARDNSVRLWDAESGEMLQEMKAHEHAVRAVAFHPTLPLAASGGFDNRMVLWDLDSGRELDRVEGKSWVTTLAFSPDGEYLLTGGGARKEDTRWIEEPEERVSLFRVVKTDGQSPADGAESAAAAR